MATLPDPPPSSPNYDQRGQQQYDQRGQQPYDQRGQQQYDQRNAQPYNQGAAARTPPPALRRGESVDVQPGDTLYKLSRRHHVSVAELMDVNGLSNPSLQPGQKIYLPEGYPARHDEPRQVASVQPPPAPPSVPSDLQAKYNGSYTVRDGESVYGISRTYGVMVAELQQEPNGINDPRGVRTGTVLKVPGGAQSVPPPSSDVADATPPPPPGTSQDPTVINRRGRSPPGGRRVDEHNQPPPASAAASPATSCALAVLAWVCHRLRSAQRRHAQRGIRLPVGAAQYRHDRARRRYAGSELKGYGNLVLLRHDNGWVTAYAHNDELMVKRGDKVQRGQVIAKAGRTGSVDQPQLHFELRQGSKPVDPVPFLERL